MDHQNQQAALAAVTRAELAAQTARALAVFDAIDEQSPNLSEHDRYDLAYSTWQAFVDIDSALPDNDVAKVAIRASQHMPEEALIDLVDVQFGEHEKRIRLDEEHGLVWLPEDDTLILTYPARLAGYTIDAVLARPRTRA